MNPYPKRLQLLLKEVYKEFPELRRHPDYRMFYLYWGYPSEREYFIILTNLIPNEYKSDNMVSIIDSLAKTFGFVEGVLMKPDDFELYVKTPIEDSINEFRGSEFKTCAYEVW
jgi:hypothetical protein